MGNYVYLSSSQYTQPLQCCLYIFLYSIETILQKYWIQHFLKLFSVFFLFFQATYYILS